MTANMNTVGFKSFSEKNCSVEIEQVDKLKIACTEGAPQEKQTSTMSVFATDEIDNAFRHPSNLVMDFCQGQDWISFCFRYSMLES